MGDVDLSWYQKALGVCITALGVVVTWAIRRLLYLDKYCLTRQEHAEICVAKEEHVYRMLRIMNRKLDKALEDIARVDERTKAHPKGQ